LIKHNHLAMNQKRIISIDVLRGITIFLMIVVNTPGSWSHVFAPFLHAKWHGCTLTDLVFPSFLFVVGLSMSQSFRNLNTTNTGNLIKKISLRAALIFIIGLLLNWFPFYPTPLSELRIFGVLQRIALSFFGAGILVVLLKKLNWLTGISILLLLMHWAILYFFGEGLPYSLENNIGRYIDIYLVGESHVYQGFGLPFDPEGLLGTLTGISQVLIGFLIGKYLFEHKEQINKRLLHLLILAVSLFALAKIWNLWLPVNKPLWTGSYVIYTVAIVSIVLLCLVEIVDKRNMVKWASIFRVFGKNPLFSYILSILFAKLFAQVITWGDTNLYAWLYTDFFSAFLSPKVASLAFALCFTLFVWLWAYWLHRKNIIIKV